MDPLLVDVLYFYPRDNAEIHNTIRFEAVNQEQEGATIVRRGQPFNGVIAFNRPYDENSDIIQLIFTLGDNPRMDTMGSVFIRPDAVHDAHSWTAKLIGVEGNNVSFELSTPVTLPVGNWSARVVTRLKAGNSREVYDFNQDLFILFNPWNKDDLTYMEDTNLLQEYVLNDVGKVWMGPIKTTRGKPWAFGQFDGVVLPAVMFMLDRGEMPYHHRGDPIKMARMISKMVNSNDDGGVLIGRWDGQYEDGTAPSEWTGSVDILAAYLESQQEVAYGQCWVFGGVVTTVCRALGIPSRAVTNLVSAHDANNSLTIDKYYSETMEEVNPENLPEDSIWNYHVWNDVWMARPDLPKGFGGWQAIDATPQETSAGMYQCGPASLEAIKQGVIGLGFDVEFMLASVNADMMRWRHDTTAETGFSMVDSNNYHIGRMILTKKPFIFDPIGDQDREDITAQYKHREGSTSERLALMNGVRHSERAKRYYSLASDLKMDVNFTLQDIETVQIGQDFRVNVDVRNNSNEARNIKASLSALSVYYNGVKPQQPLIKKAEGKLYVGPGKLETISIKVTPSDYLPKLVEYGNIKITAMAIVDETKQSWADDDDFQILKPDIEIKFNTDLIINEAATASLSLTNPLSVPLTGCEYRFTSSGITGRTLRFPANDIQPGATVATELPIQPNKLGNINFVATFKSNELKDINGAATAEVYEG